MHRRTTRLADLLAITVAAGLLATSAAAQSPGRGPGDDGHRGHESRVLDLLDTDGDGMLSLAEITAEQDRLIGAADVDGDGQLSVDEFRRRGRLFVRLGTTTFFDLMDADGDMNLTAAEITTPSERWFSRRDTNGDGALEADEIAVPWTGRHRR